MSSWLIFGGVIAVGLVAASAAGWRMGARHPIVCVHGDPDCTCVEDGDLLKGEQEGGDGR